ncbi:hypothetical protein QR680_001969 [Steinernema hermaphroditum]|uniref:Synaptogyrin n=1 Tax=Steinernema hermaphroditum TaxID=289476 RepID=A0AA39H3I0_9BILA|nr:hypothetical protein QR680_001969 [Steinernema hermaphroditum]
MEAMKAYGAGLAGGQFDAQAFIRKPTVIFRIFAFVIGLLLWLWVSGGVWHRRVTGQLVCLYNYSLSTCSFGSAVGFFSVAAAAALLILDARFHTISAIQTRRRAVLVDLAVSGFMTFLFLITFFTLWSKYSSFELNEEYSGKSAKLSIFFAFVSLLSWGGASFFAWRRYQEGAGMSMPATFSANPDASLIEGGEYGYEGGNQALAGDSYQNAPFAVSNQGATENKEMPDPSSFYQGY